jgi:hypothetical protein
MRLVPVFRGNLYCKLLLLQVRGARRRGTVSHRKCNKRELVFLPIGYTFHRIEGRAADDKEGSCTYR